MRHLSEILGVQLLTLRMEKNLLLPNTQVTTDLTTISIRECLYSLLSDDELMKDDNLLFNGDSPFDPPVLSDPPDPNHLYDDINSGLVYQNFWDTFCPPGSQCVYLPFIFFIDKTFIDKKGKLNSEPVTFTLGIFNRHVHNTVTEAWRSIGLFPDSFLAGYNDSIEKIKDYHHVFDLIFTEFKKMQQTDGIAWNLKYKGAIHKVIFVPAIHIIITDTKCADDLCAKFQFRGTSVLKSTKTS